MKRRRWCGGGEERRKPASERRGSGGASVAAHKGGIIRRRRRLRRRSSSPPFKLRTLLCSFNVPALIVASSQLGDESARPGKLPEPPPALGGLLKAPSKPAPPHRPSHPSLLWTPANRSRDSAPQLTLDLRPGFIPTCRTAKQQQPAAEVRGQGSERLLHAAFWQPCFRRDGCCRPRAKRFRSGVRHRMGEATPPQRRQRSARCVREKTDE